MDFSLLALLFVAITYQTCYADPSPVINIYREIQYAKKYPSPISNSTLIPLLVTSLASQKHTPLTKLSFRQEYDYIVVGTGPGGSVIANRLSEDTATNVLVLEAGGDPPLLTDVPATNRYFIGGDLDWNYMTVPQQYTASGMVNRQIPWPSSKVLGGSTIVHGNIFVRGNQRNFDKWAQDGATGWSYRDVYPYFVKSEDNTNPDIASNGYHGTRGPLTVSRPGNDPVLRDAVREAADKMGYPFVDANAQSQYGFLDYQGTLRNGQRCSSVKAFLVPAENRPNLDIVSNALVTKVIINQQRATAVQLRYEGKTFEVRAKREIVLSAGTIKSPQLLMISGIGPRKHLESLGIPVLADLPVGLNLQDQVGGYVNFVLSDDIQPFNKRLANDTYISRYINSRQGPLASMEGLSNIALLNNDRPPNSTLPDYELYFLEPAPLASEASAKQFGLNDKVFQQALAPYENSTNYACYIEIQNPKSRGTIKLNTTDIIDQPLIDPQYLRERADIHTMVSGLKTCIRLGESEPLQKIGSKIFAALYPGCEGVSQNEDLYWACVVRTVVNPAAQYVGTCKMGAQADPTTVVDPELRVKGIRGLRVVDASVMPTIITGNTQAAVYMIGEKASDMIKAANPTTIPSIQTTIPSIQLI